MDGHVAAAVRRVIAKLALLVVIAGAFWGAAVWTHRATTFDTTGTVVGREAPFVVEVAYEDADGVARTAVASSELFLDDHTTRDHPDVGQVVPVRVDRSDPATVRLVEPPMWGMHERFLVPGILVYVLVVIVVAAPEYVRVTEPGEVREDHGFYWRS